jgi:glyoxalase family protein
MNGLIRSLHHVTATVTDAQQDLDHYAGILGLRLVKKTVNFDNHNVYHFYYGNERGTPSTIMTTFPYKGWGVPVGTKGAGQITVTSFSVPAANLDFWRERLESRSVPWFDAPSPFGEDAIEFDDPSGLRLSLVATTADERTPWTTAELDAANAIRGIHSVTLSIRSPDTSIRFLTDVLKLDVLDQKGDRTRVGLGAGGPGHTLEIRHAADAPAAVNGLGTVHHVAMAIGTPEEQLEVREMLVGLGCRVTEVRDRQYFKSIYFREPGGVLYEIATLGPGFDVDEELADLGRGLKLPPWEEPNRPEIQTKLPPIRLA